MTTYMMSAVLWTAGLMLAQCLVAQTNTQVEETLTPVRQTAKGKVASESPRPPAVRALKAGEPRAASINNELIGQNISVDAGKSVRINAKSDFGGAERAFFGVYSDPSVNISKVRIAVWWGTPGTNAFAVQDFILGSSFYYTNTGGGSVSVGGPSLFVDVINEGDTPLTIQQLTVYAVTH